MAAKSSVFFMHLKTLVLWIALLPLISGCSSHTTEKNPTVDLSRIKQIHIESRLNDNHGIDRMIASELQRWTQVVLK